jgi:peptide/nickel transport system substrate-binding protein
VSNPDRRKFLTGSAAAATVAWQPRLLRAAALPGVPLVMGCTTEPTSFDPLFQYFGPNRQAHFPVFEPLAAYDARLGVVPALAESWSLLDPTTWEFIVRDGVRFHDGTALEADDVIFSLERASTVPSSPSTLGVYTQAIQHITAPRRRAVRISTKTVSPLLVRDLANIPMVSRRAASGLVTADFDRGMGLIGTGPYRFARWDKGQAIIYQAFARYWGSAPEWSAVTARLIPDGQERLRALRSGEVQLIDQVPPQEMASLLGDPTMHIAQIESNFVMYLHMDQFRDVTPSITDRSGRPIGNPLRDVRVRKALSKAIDRDAIVRDALSGAASPASQFLPSTFEGTISDLGSERYDPGTAQELLAAAGFADGFKMTIHGTKGRYPNDSTVLETIARSFTRLGLDIRAVALPPTEFFKRASSGPDGLPEFSLIQTGWSSVDPSGALKGLVTTFDKSTGAGSSNRGRYSNAQVDALLRNALATIEDDRRAALLSEATRLAVVEDQAIIPLFYPTNIWASAGSLKYDPRVDGSTFPMDAHRV